MRFYKIDVLNPDGSPYQIGGGSGQSSNPASWSSLDKNGNFDPGALNIEVDMGVTTQDQSLGAGHVRLWGIGLTAISQAADFADPNKKKQIKISLGMSKGLPLANPNQVGAPILGTIDNAFGNWQGTTQTLDLLFNAYTGSTSTSVGSSEAPVNIVIDWKAGKNLADYLSATLNTAYPNLKQNFSFTNFVLTYDEVGHYDSLLQFCTWLTQRTQDIWGVAGYSGVLVYIQNNMIYATDNQSQGSGSSQGGTKKILFTDLIGQPVWQGTNVIQVFCMMRSDIGVGDSVTLPAAQTTSSAQSLTQYRDKLTFSGTWFVQEVRYVGNFRQPNADSWVTVLTLNSIADNANNGSNNSLTPASPSSTNGTGTGGATSPIGASSGLTSSRTPASGLGAAP